MPTFRTSDGTSVEVTGPLDPRVPLVVLLHGLSGNLRHMTGPLNAPDVGGMMFNRVAPVTVLRDAGLHPTPPVVPVNGFDTDPLLTSARSWREALNGAGFPTLAYSQVQPRGTLAPNVAQLNVIATEVLANSALAGMRLAFLAHSRGGILLRQFLVGAAVNSTFMSRVVAAITLHSPHQGSGLANAAVSVDALAATAQAAFAGAGVPPPGFLTLLRDQVNSPAYPEIGVGSPTLSSLTAMEPVPGIEWHTFGGTSTWFTRLRAHFFTPDSGIPLPIPLPIPLFHWSTAAVQVGVVPDPFSFVPVPVPVVAELQAALMALALLSPELTNGSGDLLTSDARAHLPFSLMRTTNFLNHAEALYDPSLQAQVLVILERFRTAPPQPHVPWESLGGDLTSGPAVCSWAAGRLDVFARAADNSLQHWWWDGSSWGSDNLGGSLTSDPAAVSWAAGRLDVFARGTGNSLEHKWWDGMSWS